MAKLNHIQQFALASCRESSVKEFFSLPPEWVIEKSDQNLLTFVREYHIKYSRFPPVKDLISKFSLAGDYSADPGHYFSEIQEDYITYKVVTYLPSAVKDFEKSPQDKLNQLRSYLSNIKTQSDDSIDSVYSENASNRYEEYKKRKGTGGVSYLSTGDPVLDDLIYGYEPTDLITFGGRGGSMKTWLIIRLALLCEKTLPKSYGPIVFITNEMSTEQINERFDSARFKLCYEDYLKGELSPRSERRYKTSLKDLEKEGSSIIIIDNVQTIANLEEKLVVYKPSICFVDGSYLFEPQMDEGYAKTVFITRNLKRVAKGFKIPLINTTQLRKNSGKKSSKSSYDSQDDFYHGSYTQDSDFAFKGYRDAKMELNMQVIYEIAKGRRVPPGTKILWTNNLISMESTFEPVEPDPIFIDEEEPSII